jgi:hypothetical protein
MPSSIPDNAIAFRSSLKRNTVNWLLWCFKKGNLELDGVGESDRVFILVVLCLSISYQGSLYTCVCVNYVLYNLIIYSI